MAQAGTFVFLFLQLVGSCAIELLQFVHLAYHFYLLLLKFHDCLTVIEVFPAAICCVFVCLFDTIYECFEESFRGTRLACIRFNCIVSPLFLPKVESNLDFINSIGIFIILFSKLDPIAISVTGHAQEPYPNLL